MNDESPELFSPAVPAELSLAAIDQRLQSLTARRKWWRRWARRAAVAIVLREGAEGPEVLMIRRAERSGDPWSGHMAFPGGLVDPCDRHSLAAAQRETQEEIGLDVGLNARLIARLSELGSPSHSGYRRMLAITPYVFILRTLPPLQLNHEVAEVLWLPLRFFLDPANRGSIRWRQLQLPCYHWHGRQIWGLSLEMLEELLAHLALSRTSTAGPD